MKFSRGFSILILLFILQASIAVNCPTEIKGGHFYGSKKCDACAIFSCGDSRNCSSYSIEAYYVKETAGCVEDFYEYCSRFSSDIDFIRSKSPKRMQYEYFYEDDDHTISRTVSYISGCDNETEGLQCIKRLRSRGEEEYSTKTANQKNKIRMLYWSDEKSSNVSESSDNGKCPICSSNSGLSCDSNGALKFIGIIAIGWILAAWIY